MNTSEVKNLINALILGADNMGQDTIVIKSNNIWHLSKEMVDESIRGNKGIKVLYHEFTPDIMHDAYEPFLQWIKEIYENSGEESPEEFMEKCQVYSLHRDMFCEYIRSGRTVRKEPIIMSEREYDLKRIMGSITSILQYAAGDGKILIVLGRIHLAGYSTIEYLNYIINNSELEGIALLCTYDSTVGIHSYMNGIWEEFIKNVEEKNVGIAMYNDNDESLYTEQEKNYFVLDFDNMEQYIDKIYNMIHTLAVEQALYYLGDIYHKIKIDKVSMESKLKIRIYELYAFAYLYAGKYQSSLMICDNIKNIDMDSLYVEFNCNYVMCMAQLYLGQGISAMMLAKKCKQISERMNDPYFVFLAKLLMVIVQLRGFTSVIIDVDGAKSLIDDDFTNEIENRGFYNHLAYIYIYAYEQSKEYYIGEYPEKNLKYFKKALEIIKRNENDKFLMDAYKKCATMYSIAGNIDEVDRNYKKCIDVLRRLNGKGEEANIYNGLGYNRMVREDFEQANIYYNQALEIFYNLNEPEMVSETFYNMAINSLMAEDYKKCCVCITASIQVLDNYGVYKPRICNRSKLYGIAAICNFKLGNGYKTQIYMEKMERIFRHILKPDGEPNYDLWDDDLFYYWFIKGIIDNKEGRYEEALKAYRQAKFHMVRSSGSMYVSYYMLAVEMSEVLGVLDLKSEREELLKDCIKFSKENENDFSAMKLKQLLDNKKIKKSVFALDINVDINVVILMAKRLGAERELVVKNRNLDFLSNWQEMFMREEFDEEQLINMAMATLRNNFGLDRILFFNVDKKKNIDIKYCDEEIEIDDEKLNYIVNFFEERKTHFVVARIDSSFEEYKEIVKNFGMNTVVSMVGIPIFMQDELQTVFITYQIMYDNFSSTEAMLNMSDLSVFKFALRQLMNEIYRANARIKIGQMNRELKAKNMMLENLAQTDNLTGLLNRQGFNKIVDEKIDNSDSESCIDQYITVMYIDLDNFKYCNDTFGHDVGDMVLKEFANLFTAIIGKSGYVVRYGGDEFVIVVENVNKYYGEEVAQAIFEELKDNDAFAKKIVDTVGKVVEIPDKNKLSCSIGIAVDEAKNVSMISDLLKHADDSLYCVKRDTKHSYKVWRKEGI